MASPQAPTPTPDGVVVISFYCFNGNTILVGDLFCRIFIFHWTMEVAHEKKNINLIEHGLKKTRKDISFFKQLHEELTCAKNFI